MTMQVVLASRGAPSVASNEDFVAATANVVAVLDGASVPPGEDVGCIHGAPWFVRRLGTALLDIFEREAVKSPSDSLSQAIVNVNALHLDCDPMNTRTPSAAVAILRERSETVEFLLLGGTTVVLDGASGVRVLTDTALSDVTTRNQATLASQRSRPVAADSYSAGRTEREIRSPWRESAGVSANYGVVDYALTGAVHRQELRRAAVLSDGAARLVSLFGTMDWPSFLDLLEEAGPDGLIARLRDIERSDPDGQRWPRADIYDDATAVLCHFRNHSEHLPSHHQREPTGL
jgi:hypothetical protein